MSVDPNKSQRKIPFGKTRTTYNGDSSSSIGSCHYPGAIVVVPKDGSISLSQKVKVLLSKSIASPASIVKNTVALTESENSY